MIEHDECPACYVRHSPNDACRRVDVIAAQAKRRARFEAKEFPTLKPAEAAAVEAGPVTILRVKRDKAKHAAAMREWRRKEKEKIAALKAAAE